MSLAVTQRQAGFVYLFLIFLRAEVEIYFSISENEWFLKGNMCQAVPSYEGSGLVSLSSFVPVLTNASAPVRKTWCRMLRCTCNCVPLDNNKVLLEESCKREVGN